jgi:hypothetical protein
VAHTLSVERLVSTYLVPGDHPDPERVRRELDEVARKFMIDSWGRALAELLDANDPSVWLIENISSDFLMELNAAEPEAVAAIWAGKMAESLVKTIARGADGESVLRFANRAEFIAWFLRDLAAGAAWNRWYYRQFETLRSLPIGPAIRQTLLREPDQAEAALLHLARTNRMRTLAGFLSRADQEILVQLCCPQETTPRRTIFAAVFAAWTAEPLSARLPLNLYLEARNDYPDVAPAEIRSAVRHISTLDSWQQGRRLEGIAAAVAAGRLTPIIGRLSPAEQETLLYFAFLASEDVDWPDRIAEVAQPSSTGYGKDRTAFTGQARDVGFATRWTGVFLLLPALIAHRELSRAYGGVEDGILRYLLLAWCVRENAAVGPEFEKTIAVAAGLAEAPGRHELGQARPRTELLLQREDLLPEDGDRMAATGENQWPEIMLEESMRSQLGLASTVLLRDFARRLPGLGRSSSAYLWRNILSGDGFITSTAGRVLVELAPRPLEIVLRLAGFDAIRLTPPWLADTEMVIRIERQ